MNISLVARLLRRGRKPRVTQIPPFFSEFTTAQASSDGIQEKKTSPIKISHLTPTTGSFIISFLNCCFFFFLSTPPPDFRSDFSHRCYRPLYCIRCNSFRTRGARRKRKRKKHTERKKNGFAKWQSVSYKTAVVAITTKPLRQCTGTGTGVIRR